MIGATRHWNKKKNDRGHTGMPIRFEWIVHPRNPKHDPFRILCPVNWHGLVGFP
jgi:hypothetical protein